ncbi:MAG: hypothetical protein GEV06_01215 [Luteitalea sp.]|nr:hypothetical protein [Luteitalea sp.]
MGEGRIDRLVAASIHQAIADCLPLQLEFYETWLKPFNWRKSELSVASVSAVLSFLRQEGHAYREVVKTAGRYAAQWTYDDLPWSTRVLGQRLVPRAFRIRRLLRLASQLVGTTSREGRLTVRMRGQVPVIELAGSVFCEVRRVSGAPLCAYYADAIEHLFRLDRFHCTVSIVTCRAMGAGCCTLTITVGDRTATDVPRQQPAEHGRLIQAGENVS